MGKIFDYDGVPVLHTTSGDLKGYFYDGVYIYKGIPYAYADRFQMPVPSKWDGVKDATTYGFVLPASEPRYTERRAYGSAPLLAAG